MWYISALTAQVGFVVPCNDAESSSAGRAKQRQQTMKTKLISTVLAVLVFTVQADSILWHFKGEDGHEAPASISDVSGSYSLARTQLGPSGSYTTQLAQSDSQGSVLYWRSGSVLESASGASGAVQMYRCAIDANNATSRYYGASYSLTDSSAVKTLFPTNANGDILPFTLELVFKAEAYDATLCNGHKNFNLVSINRRGAVNNGVLKFNGISGGQIYLQCESMDGSNGDVFNVACLDETDFRDGKWHHVSLVYTLDETNHSGTMNVYLDYVLKKTCSPQSASTVKCLKFTESNKETEGNAQLNIGENNVNNAAGLSIDEVRLTQSALDVGSFIHATSETGYGEKAAGTIARWTFDAPGQSGETVGSDYGAVASVDGAKSYGLRGGTHAKSGATWESELVAGGDFPPVYTNDVPYAYIWDPGARRIANPDNATSVFFKHADENGASSQGIAGSVLNTSAAIADVCFPSNFTFECFMKCDKSFGGNVSGLFGFFNGSAYNGNTARYVAIDLPNTSEKIFARLIEDTNDNKVSSTKKMDDGEWHHVAANFDASSGSSRTIKLWVDYEEKGTKTIYGASSFDPSKVAIVFGALPNDNAFSGFIDEPRITIGNIGADRFLRRFVPRENLTGVWLVPTNSVLSGKEWHSPGTDFLEGDWADGDLALSGSLPCLGAAVKIGNVRVKLSNSVAFSGNGGMTIPCAATVGTNVFAVEANFCGNGTVFAKKMFGGKSSWAVKTTADGFASVEIDGVATATAVNVDDGKWHHAALIVDRSGAQTAKLYIDGVPAASVDASGMTLDAGDFVVGEDFVGDIVGVRFSPGAVPPDKFMIAGPVPGFYIICK
jgi:hypothetical protein